MDNIFFWLAVTVIQTANLAALWMYVKKNSCTHKRYSQLYQCEFSNKLSEETRGAI